MSARTAGGNPARIVEHHSAKSARVKGKASAMYWKMGIKSGGTGRDVKRDPPRRIGERRRRQSPEAAPPSTAHVNGAMARSSQAPALMLTAPYASAIRIAMVV